MQWLEIAKYNTTMLKSILLLILAITSNFLGNTLGCQLQYVMVNNMYVKHLFVVLIIYISINVSSPDEHPMMLIGKSVFLWACYVIFTRQDINFVGISGTLFLLAYVCDTFVNYYKNKENIVENKETEKGQLEGLANKLATLRNILLATAILTVLCGFAFYFAYQYREYGPQFSYLLFIFGKPVCSKLK